MRRYHLASSKPDRRHARFDIAKHDMLVVHLFTRTDAQKLNVQSSREAALLGECALECSRAHLPSLHKEAAIAFERDVVLSYKINSAVDINNELKDEILARLCVHRQHSKRPLFARNQKHSVEMERLRNELAAAIDTTLSEKNFVEPSCTER